MTLQPFAGVRPARTLMIQGTASDVGKSIITTALCRILVQDGLSVAPYKSQNMSLNSYVTPDGKEIGRAQGMQADACGIPATTDMNPILLKPTTDRASQVVVHGKPYRTMDAYSYRHEYLAEAGMIAREALDRLRLEHDIVVLEGAGSPAEINLKDRDIVNMRMAGWADAPVILVADIDRGGVFASIVGTMELLEPDERARVKGFLINKFRGDVALLQPGLDWLEQRTGKPVLGVIPHIDRLKLESEDSLSIQKLATAPHPNGELLDIAVIRFPRIANFTDIDPLIAEQDTSVRYVTRPEEFGTPDVVILPGSKNTAEDLLFVREMGLEPLLRAHQERGGWIAGICGGYQMLGQQLRDPNRIESDNESLPGLGFFPMETVFATDKKTERVSGQAVGWLLSNEQAANDSERTSFLIEGYEIHMGRTSFLLETEHPMTVGILRGTTEEPPHQEGARSTDGKVWGTYIHGIMHNDEFRRNWLNAIRVDKGLTPLAVELRFNLLRKAEFDRLADHVRQHINLQLVYKIMNPNEEADQ
ncbi:cobyric acid synthase [Cohnella mopanensis]|uniref:cobyric acid synthase n=1 Tax=Cohnella mopanensis TaxID=2911966 RepID=UPI001EF8C335|nr:cobyric acid synthase [Cohnella mopanensis]